MKKLVLLLGLALISVSCQEENKRNSEISHSLDKSFSFQEKQQINLQEKEINSAVPGNNTGNLTPDAPAQLPRTLCTRKSMPAATSTDKASITASKPDFEELAPQIQSFKINPLVENVLQTNTGNKFIVPAYSFPGKDPITINIQEYIGKSAAYTQQLTTQTTDGNLLESAGMFQIEAFNQSGAVSLREGAEMILEMATPVDLEMGIYYGEEDENGDIYWNFDSLGTTPSPVIVMNTGRLKKAFGEDVTNMYKFSKAQMLEMLGKSWKTEVSLDKEGRIIGFSKCAGKTAAETKACESFFEILTYLDKNELASNFQKWQIESSFSCMTHRQYQEKLNSKNTQSAMASALQNYEPRNGNGRKYFSIGAIGFINIDKDIPLPELQAKEDVLVNIENGMEEIKLVFAKKNTVVAPKKFNNYYVFEKIPVGAEIKVISTYAEGEKIFFAGREHKVIKDGDNGLRMSYSICSKENLSEKIAEFAN